MPIQSEPNPPSTPQPAARRPLPGWMALAVAVALLVVTVAVALTLATGPTADRAPASSPPSIAVGTPGGEVVAAATPTAQSTPRPTPRPTAEPSPEPTVAPTAAPTAARATPPPATPAATPAAPSPTPAVVTAGSPADAVAAFYEHVGDGRFDAAHGLWSDRMRATYPRLENLDARFDQTASITFEQLYVVDQGGTTATVQANFVETYDAGSTRRFVGYWELVLVDGRWLLDAPHY